MQRAEGKPLWSFATQGKVDSSPLVVGDKVVFGSDESRLYVVSLASDKELWTCAIGQPLTGSPAVVKGKVAIGSEHGNVYAFGPKTKP